DQRGLRYGWGAARLDPPGARDGSLQTRRVALGYSGIGVAFSGSPFGGDAFDFGHLPPVLVRESEAVRSHAHGVSLGRLLAPARWRNRDDGVPYFDVALGSGHKEVEDRFSGMSGYVTSLGDRGILLRAGGPITIGGGELAWPIRADIAFGY